jgi:hypothetical protein
MFFKIFCQSKAIRDIASFNNHLTLLRGKAKAKTRKGKESMIWRINAGGEQCQKSQKQASSLKGPKKERLHYVKRFYQGKGS